MARPKPKGDAAKRLFSYQRMGISGVMGPAPRPLPTLWFR